jgi:ABC-type antimicrobial peptide transport system permease subunit
MSTPTRRLKGRGSRSTLSSILSLASSHWRRTWFLLLIMTIGMVAAVVIVCTVPLFASVMNTAGLRQELRADPNSAEIEINTTTLGLSTQVAANVQDLFAALMKQDLGDLAQPSQFTILSSNFAFATPSKDVRSLLLYGVSMQQAASHLGPIQGHLAQITTAQQHEIEVMMTPDSARKLGLKVGDAFPLQLTFSLGPLGSSHTQAITARIAGLFTVNAANSSYWHGEDFKHFQIGSGAGTVFSYTMLVPNESLLAIADGLAAQYQTKAIFSLGQTLRWYYQLDVPRITIDQLDTLIGDCASLQADYTSNYGYLEDGNAPPNPVFPYLSSTQLSSPLLSGTDNPSNLENFRSRTAVVQIPTILLTIQIILVILFFISLMTSLLIESQASTIALLRSRGASRSQVFGSLFVYFVALGIAAVLIGVPLTILATVFLAQRFLPVDGRDAIGLIANHPWQATEQILWYAAGILLVMLLAMVVSLHFAVRMDVLALRRESGRTHKRPLWQRLNLDLFAGVIAIVGYVLSLYLNSIGNLLQGGAQALVITPISVIAPFFLVLGCLLVLLRLFPLLLRLGAWLAVRGRGAASMLALAQVSRAPRQSIRTTMLLALSVAFLLFTVVYQSTQTQHIQEVTNYLASADFSGGLTTSVAGAARAETIRPYQAIPGVITASIGFVGTGITGTGDLPMEIRAVDATNFGQTVIWPSAAAAQTGNALLKRLADLRGSALLGSVVPAVVDTITMNKLHAHVGSLFQVTVDGYNLPMNCLIIGVVPHIPSINDLTSFDNQGKALSEGGVLVDYQTYTTAFTREVRGNPRLRAPKPAPLNHIWLHSRDDAASVASVRIGLTRLNLLNLSDRRAILAALNTDPLYLILSGTLTIGTVAALLLALIGTLLTSWLSARTRLTNFAVLRAIGATPRQLASMLTWEQAVVYLTGLLLGVGIGEFIVQTVVPALTLTNANTNVSSNRFYTLQTAFPTQIVLPASLLLALLALVAIYGAALTMMVRIISQPSLSQTLRLNED